MKDPLDKLEKGEIIYEECATHLRYMLDWRHKILLRFFVTYAALFYIAKWLWETNNSDIHTLLFLPFFLAAFSSFAFFVMDKRNMQVVEVCRATGKQIEETVFETNGLFVKITSEIAQKRGLFSYTWMLFLIYIGSSLISLIGSVCVFLKYEGWRCLFVLLK